MTKLFAIAFASVVAAASAPAAATMEPAQRSTLVRFHDLYLSTAEGMKELDRRISLAAQRICRPDGKLTIQTVSDAADCVRAAKSRASDEIATAVVRFGPQAIQLAQRYFPGVGRP